jgi:hypothetical protein
MHVILLQPQQTQMQLQQMKSPLLAAVVVERHVHTAAATADADAARADGVPAACCYGGGKTPCLSILTLPYW